MHLLIPFAAPGSEAGRQTLRSLELPNLAALATRLDAGARDDGDELSFSPPHERALARAIGLAGPDGGLPWAAHRMPADGRDPADLAWGLLTPCHWHLGSDQITLADPDDLKLDEASSRALLHAVHDLFDSEGFVLVYGAALRWYLAHESLAGRRSASLDRAIGRSVDRWMTPGDDARRLRRLQNEVQMRLFEHPLNVEREALGLLPVNSVWLSGCGINQGTKVPPDLVVDDRLRRPALAEDWGAWRAAWQDLDAGPVAALAHMAEATLTLCGERSAMCHRVGPATAWRRLTARWRGADAPKLLESL